MDVALWKDLSSSNLCGPSCGIVQKEGHVALRLFSAGVMQPGQKELPLHSELHWVNALSYTISNPIYYDMTFDIERPSQKDLRYSIRYQHAISNDVYSISKA